MPAPAQAPPSPAAASADSVDKILTALAAGHDGLVRTYAIGKSSGGRDLRVIEITNVRTRPAAEKPAIWIDPGFRGDDPSAVEAVLALARTLAENPAKDARIDGILDRFTLFLMPQPNPGDARAGVDLERNWPEGWLPDAPGNVGGSGGGPYPLSEPETRSVIDFLIERPHVAALLVLGGAGRSVRGPRIGADRLSADDRAALETLGSRIAAAAGRPWTAQDPSLPPSNRAAWAVTQYGAWPIALGFRDLPASSTSDPAPPPALPAEENAAVVNALAALADALPRIAVDTVTVTPLHAAVSAQRVEAEDGETLTLHVLPADETTPKLLAELRATVRNEGTLPTSPLGAPGARPLPPIRVDFESSANIARITGEARHRLATLAGGESREFVWVVQMEGDSGWVRIRTVSAKGGVASRMLPIRLQTK